MNPLRKNILKHFCLVLFLCATANSFPAEDLIVAPAIIKNSSPAKVEDSTSPAESVTSKKSQPSSASSISTTSSLLFKDKKPILTYLLGQPKKQGSVSSPAQLLSPDRYEFFTFDDDGQIVKKLMSVKEIQKIIANSEKGSLEEHGSPIEYYQILTVTPDVESIPTVSRINPNEPLFSIHDVIASVQNVLKSEMKTKQSQSSSGVNNTNFLASASSTHFEILTDETAKPQTAEVQKPTSTASQQTNEPTFTFKLDEPVKVTTYRPTSQINFNFLKGNVASGSSGTQKPNVPTGSATTQKPLEILASIFTQKPLTLVTSTATQKTQEPAISSQAAATSPASKPVQLVGSSIASKPLQPAASSKPLETAASSVSQETLVSAASTHKIINEASAGVPVPESRPLSLSDAHPGLLSNDSFLDMKPFTVEQISRIAEPEPIVQELKEAFPSRPSENFVKIETVEKNQAPIQQQTAQFSAVETSTSKILLPITADLADSVSSVLWQIASENSMIESSAKPTEVTSISSAATEAPEQVVFTDGTSQKIPSPLSTTELPAQSRSTVKIEKLSENPLTVLQNILRTQNRPRPFQKIPTIEKGTPDVAELRNEPFTTTTPAYETFSSPSSTVVILTESEETSSSSEENVTSELPTQTNQNTNQEVSSTVAPQHFVILVSPDAVVQSPEHLKPVTDKAQIVNLNKTSSQNQTIEGVQVIQEANIGQIPRTTEIPGQVVKEIQRMEIPIADFVVTEETLSNSASSTYSTQVPQTVPETTTTAGSEEEKTEISFQKEAENSKETTVPTLDLAETKNDDQKESSPSERVDITFVPMLIKTPSEYKQEEALLKSEIQTESKEEVETTTEKLISEKATDVTELYVTETSNPSREEESFESKELPESTSELKTDVPGITTESTQKETILGDDLVSDDEFSQFGTLKQNTQNNKPHFGKPQKPVYIKPIKTKPQSDIKLPKPSATTKPFLKDPVREPDNKKPYENHLQSSPSVLELEAAPDENLGLEATVANLDGDIKRFADLCNELAFSLWSSVTHNGLSFVRSLVISPFAVTSLLAMVFLGARGPTSGQMNDVLRLDDMVTFNPHLVFRNVTESLVISRNPGVATAAFVRELYSDKSKGKLLDFYKERVQQFYDGHVEEVNFKTIGDTLRRQTNHLVKRQTWGKITDFLRGSNLMPRPPLAAFGANIFQTDCTRASTKDRDGEMYFVILPASRLRRLVPIPAVVWRDGFLAGYEPNLDATAVSINPSDSAVSTIFVLPGQQGLIAPGDTLARLEHHLLGSSYKKGHWSRLMRSLLPRPGLELQIPRLSHKSVINVTTSLQRMGLKDLFSADKADLTGLNGLANDLHLSDMLQVNLFSTCGEEPIGARHHSEIYPATPILRREKSADNIFSESVDSLWAVSDFEDPAISALPLELRPRQARVPLSKPGARIPEPPRLRFDRPFLFFVRHNPTGLILHMGRFNPRLMP